MHRLHLLRHAKSNPDDAIDDHERPLSRRGRDAARLLAERLPTALGTLDLVLCSTALRARETMELALARCTPGKIAFERGLYLASASVLLRRLRRVNEDCGAVLLVGHNPGVQELALALAAADSPGYAALAGGKFPTAARASFEIAGDWDELGRTRHRLIDYATPKSLAEE